MFTLHVDDIISATFTPKENQCFKKELKSCWEISDLGPTKHVLGIAIMRDFNVKTIILSQMALINKVVEQFHQINAHSINTPMVASLQLQTPDKTILVPKEIATWIQ